MLVRFFNAVHEYCSESEWAVLTDMSFDMTMKEDIIIARALDLGCINPSEHRLKWMTSLALAVSVPDDKLITITTPHKLDIFAAVKTELRRRTRRDD